jgi:hypothetical protein
MESAKTISGNDFYLKFSFKIKTPPEVF